MAESPSAPAAVATFDFEAPAIDGLYQSGDITAAVRGTEVLEPGADGRGTAARLSKDFWLNVSQAGASPLQGLDAVTISYDSKPDPQGNTGWALYAARTIDAPTYGQETYFGTLDTSAKLTLERYNNSGSRDVTGNLTASRAAGAWQHVDIVFDGTTVRLYVDRQLVAKNTQGPGLTEILGATGGILQLGKANWGSGEYFSGLIDNVTITPAALSAAQLGAPSPQSIRITAEGIEEDNDENGATLRTWEGESTSLHATVTPTGAESDVAWEASAPEVVEVHPDGTLHAVAEGIAVVTAIAGGDATVQASLTVTVAATTPESVVDRDAQILTVPAEARGDFSLPRVGARGSTITWEVVSGGDAATIDDGVSAVSHTVRVARPQVHEAAAQVQLRATVLNNTASVTRDFDVLVQPLPASAGDDSAYVWAFFTGEGVGGEKISLAASKGNNALDWNTLNSGEPLFTSTLGEQGLRDPFILRSPDGDKFFMIATDLKIDGRPGGFTGAQTHGSLAIEVWESTDLVTWSDQRHVQVSDGIAGNTWAPEAYWDEELGLYVVYWASNLFDSDIQSEHANKPNYNRMMVATTPDFIEFSEPEVWIDVDRRGQDGAGSIDVTVAKHNGTYYRVYKDEKSMTLRQEHSNDLLATVKGNYPVASGADDEWVEDGVQIGNGQDNGYGGTFSAGEGPSLFPANPGDVNGYQYYLFADQPNYHGGPNHYVPMATNDITDAAQWRVIGDELPASRLPVNSDGGKPRHGTIMPVTRAQYEAVLAAYAPEIAITSAEVPSISTTPGVAPALPEVVSLTTAAGEVLEVGVSWDEVSDDFYASAGEFTLAGVAQDDSRYPVTLVVTVGDSPAVSDPAGGTATADSEGPSQKVAPGHASHLASTGSVGWWGAAGAAALAVLAALGLLWATRARRVSGAN